MRVTIHRWPVLEVLKGDEGARRYRRTKKPCQTVDTTAEILPRSIHVLFGMGDWRDFSFEGHAIETSMRDWVVDPNSVKEVARERVRIQQELRKSQSGVKT